jgi:hypothetical protein
MRKIRTRSIQSLRLKKSLLKCRTSRERSRKFLNRQVLRASLQRLNSQLDSQLNKRLNSQRLNSQRRKARSLQEQTEICVTRT